MLIKKLLINKIENLYKERKGAMGVRSYQCREHLERDIILEELELQRKEINHIKRRIYELKRNK